MLYLVAIWFLFVFPLLLAGAYQLGARTYAQAEHRVVPGLLPKFTSSRGKGDNGSVPVTGGNNVTHLPRV